MDRVEPEPRNEASIATLLRGLEQDASAAQEAIWRSYFTRLVTLARERLRRRGAKRRVRDEEDVVVSVFDSLFTRAREGRFPELADELDLWKLLITLTERKARNAARAERARKRGGGAVRGESAFRRLDADETGGLAEAAVAPTAAEADAFVASVRECLEGIDPELAQLGADRLAGFSVAEIADQNGCSVATTERRLRLLRRSLAERSQPP